MRHSDPHEGDRPCKSSHTGRKNTGKKDQKYPESLDINSHILRVSLPQLIGADRFLHKKYDHHSKKYHSSHSLHIPPGHTGKATQ